MDTETLRLFIEVVQQRSFAAVARDRDLDPSSVSRAIAALESELDVRLFQRTTRAMTLTEVGEHFFNRLEPLISDIARIREELASLRADPIGTLRLSASVAFGQIVLVPLLSQFQAVFPKLKLELILTDTNLDLVADRIDLAIRLAPSYRADVIGSKLFVTRYRAVASAAYLDREGAPDHPSELAGRSCLLFALPDFRSRWIFRDQTTPFEVPVQGNIVASSALALRQAALDGLGPALLADWLIEEDLARGELIDLFPTFDVTATSFDTAAWLLYPSRTFMPLKVRGTIDFLRAQLSARKWRSADAAPDR